MLLINLMKFVHECDLGLVCKRILLFDLKCLHIEGVGGESEGFDEFDGAAMETTSLGDADLLCEFDIIFLYAFSCTEFHYFVVHDSQLK